MYYLDSRYLFLPLVASTVRAVSSRWSTITPGLPTTPSALSNSAGASAGGLDLYTIMDMMPLAILLLVFLLTPVQVPLTASRFPSLTRMQWCQFSLPLTLSFIFSLLSPSTVFLCFYPFIILLSLHSDTHGAIVFNFIVRTVKWLEELLPGWAYIISVPPSSTSTSSHMEPVAGEEDENNQITHALSQAEQQV